MGKTDIIILLAFKKYLEQFVDSDKRVSPCLHYVNSKLKSEYKKIIRLRDKKTGEIFEFDNVLAADEFCDEYAQPENIIRVRK